MPAPCAPGPDGFTAEFLRACWGTIKHDVIAVFHQLYQLRGRGFHRLNQAMVSLLPERSDAQAIDDFRPISLIHLIAKVFAKTLSLRLAPNLDRLISKNQNTFIAGRSLHDNFVLVRQSMRLLHQLRAPRVLLKLDLARAFDTISWPFLFEVLRQHGFGSRFLDWLAILLSSACSRVLINGEPGPPIWHRRGLRQGDPLSPQLFVQTVDTLGRLFRRAASLGILEHLHPRRPIPVISLYTNDVVLFCHPSPSDLAAIKAILELFGRATGLHVNYSKSSATMLNCPPGDTALISELLGCKITDLPLTYLGIPLTIRRLTAPSCSPWSTRLAACSPTGSPGS